MGCSCASFFIVVVFVEALFIAFICSLHFGLSNACSGVFFVFVFFHTCTNHMARWSALRSVLRSRHSVTESRRGLTKACSSAIPIITALSPQCMVSMLVFTGRLSRISLGGRIRAKGNSSTWMNETLTGTGSHWCAGRLLAFKGWVEDRSSSWIW